MKTTLKKIRSHSPCASGWEKLLTHLGKIKADDEPLDLLTILNGNGLDDTLWCFRAVDGYDREIRLFGVWCARQVQHLMIDQRSIDALDVAERFANGDATIEELAAARDAAWGTAWDAAGAAAWGQTRRTSAGNIEGVREMKKGKRLTSVSRERLRKTTPTVKNSLKVQWVGGLLC